jgi:hypothetical protein
MQILTTKTSSFGITHGRLKLSTVSSFLVGLGLLPIYKKQTNYSHNRRKITNEAMTQVQEKLSQ